MIPIQMRLGQNNDNFDENKEMDYVVYDAEKQNMQYHHKFISLYALIHVSNRE